MQMVSVLNKCTAGSDLIKDFKVEVRMLAKVRHPCITTVMGAVTGRHMLRKSVNSNLKSWICSGAVIYIYIHTYIHIYVCIYIYIHTYTHTHTHTHNIHIYTYIYII
jgi:hypothetical protein